MKDIPPEAIAHYIQYPIDFIEKNVYGIQQRDGTYKYLSDADVKADLINKRIEPQTKQMLNAFAKYDYIAVASGRGCTKTTFLTYACLNFIFTRVNAKIIVTGPKYDALKATIWAEMLKWLTRSRLTDVLKWTAEKMYHQYAPGLWFAQILTSKQKENISGIHADHVLWLLDEASNIEDEIFNAIYGGMSDLETKIILTGNVTKTSGFFYRITQIENKLGWNPDTGWYIMQFSSEDSKRKNPKWFKSMQRFPRDSDMYRVYVLGLPPKGSPRAVITIADCEAARMRSVNQPDRRKTHVPLEIGLDPAAEGDDLTAIAVRFGMKLMEIRVFAKTKAPEVVLQTLKIVREYRNKLNYIHKIKVKVDDTAFGNAVRHHLALNDTDNIEVIGVNFGGKGDENYADMATKMWFHMADVIDKVGLPNDDDLIEELAAREWNPAPGERMKVEPKYEYKKRLGRSPDRADACILCFWDGTKKIFSRGEDTESNVKAFEIDWYLRNIYNYAYQGLLMIEAWNITALILNDDISIDGISCIYQYYVNKLWVYANFHYEIPIAEIVSKEVKTTTHADTYKDDREAKVYGNMKMFKKIDGARPFGQVLRQNGLLIREPIQYEEYGAIALAVSLFKNDNVIMHRNTLRARQQFGEWSIKDGKPDKKGFGCCEAFLLVCSEIRRLMKSPPKKSQAHDYKPVREPKKQKVRSFWMTR